MAILGWMKSICKRPKAEAQAEPAKPEVKVAEVKQPETGEQKAGEA